MSRKPEQKFSRRWEWFHRAEHIPIVVNKALKMFNGLCNEEVSVRLEAKCQDKAEASML